jgi:hypothetical protein
MRVFSRFSPKKVPLEDTTDSVVVLAVGDNGQRGREVGWGDGGWRGVGGVVGGVACRPVLLPSSSRPPRHRRGRGGMVGYSYSSSSTCPCTTISRGDFGENVSLYILNYHSCLHFRHSQRLRMLAPHQYKQVIAVELVSVAFHLVLNHFCAQS